MRIVWTEPAVEDLASIKQHIERDSEFYGARVVEGVIERAEQLTTFPRSGRVVPAAGRDDVREVYCHSYRIIYRLEPARVLILAVIHGSRDMSALSAPPWE